MLVEGEGILKTAAAVAIGVWGGTKGVELLQSQMNGKKNKEIAALRKELKKTNKKLKKAKKKPTP